MALQTSSIATPSPGFPDSKEFWESPLHVSRLRYPDFDIMVHGEWFRGWDYTQIGTPYVRMQDGWDPIYLSADTYNQTYPGANFQNAINYGLTNPHPGIAGTPINSSILWDDSVMKGTSFTNVNSDLGKQRLMGSVAIKCMVAASSAIGADTGFWVRDSSGPHITSFAEINAGINKNTTINSQNNTLLEEIPTADCKTCLEKHHNGAYTRLYDMSGSNASQAEVLENGFLRVIDAQPGDRFTIYNTAPGSSSIAPEYTPYSSSFVDWDFVDPGDYPLISVGGIYSSSYFLYANGVLTKRYFDFDIYETGDIRWQTQQDKDGILRSTLAPSTINHNPDIQLATYINTPDSGSTIMNRPYSSLNKWPYIPADAASQILLKIPRFDELDWTNLNESDSNSRFSGSGNVTSMHESGSTNVPDFDGDNDQLDRYQSGPMTYFIYTEATTSRHVRQLYDARPLHADNRDEATSDVDFSSDKYMKAANNPTEHEWTLSLGAKIPGYFHTHSSGVGTWMPAGTYTKMEAFAMAITHYSPLFSASYDAGDDTGSIKVYNKICSESYYRQYHHLAKSESKQWNDIYSDMGSTGATNNGGINDYSGYNSQQLTPDRIINSINTARGRYSTHTMVPNWISSTFQDVYGPAGNGGDTERHRIAHTNRSMFSESYVNSIGYINNLHTIKIAQLYKARHNDHEFNHPHSYNSPPEDRVGTNDEQFNSQSVLQNHWSDYTNPNSSHPGPYAGVQSVGSYNGTLKSSVQSPRTQVPIGYHSDKGFYSVVYTASMPTAIGYTQSHHVADGTDDGGGNTGGDGFGQHQSSSWKHQYNIKTMYYDWNHYNYSGIWKGVEICPKRTFWIDEYRSKTLTQPPSYDTINTWIGRHNISGSNQATPGSPQDITLNSYNWTIGADGAAIQDPSKFSNPTIYKHSMKQRPGDLEINNWGSTGLMYSERKDNCFACEKYEMSFFDTAMRSNTMVSHMLQPSGSAAFLMGKYGVNSVTPLSGLHKPGYLKNIATTQHFTNVEPPAFGYPIISPFPERYIKEDYTYFESTITKKWWKLYYPQSVVLHSGDEISPMEWGKSITFDDQHFNQRVVKRPMCACTNLLDWKNYAITPHSPLLFVTHSNAFTDPRVTDDGTYGLGNTAGDNQTQDAEEHQYYRLHFSDGYSFTAAPYARLFSYDPTATSSNPPVPSRRLNEKEGVFTSSIDDSFESQTWPYHLTSRTIREIAVNPKRFKTNNYGFITCTEIGVGNAIASGFVFLTGIEKLFGGYSYAGKQAQADYQVGNLRGMGTSNNFNDDLFQNHFTLKGTSSACQVPTYLGNEVGSTPYPFMTHPRTHFPKFDYSSSIFDGILMLENGLYVGFESPAQLGIDGEEISPMHTALGTGSNTGSAFNPIHTSSRASKSVSPGGAYPDYFVHKSDYIDWYSYFEDTESVKRGSFHSSKPGKGCKESEAVNFDPYAVENDSCECSILFYHHREGAYTGRKEIGGGYGPGSLNDNQLKYMTESVTQSIQTLYGFMTSSATGTYSDVTSSMTQHVPTNTQIALLSPMTSDIGGFSYNEAADGQSIDLFNQNSGVGWYYSTNAYNPDYPEIVTAANADPEVKYLQNGWGPGQPDEGGGIGYSNRSDFQFIDQPGTQSYVTNVLPTRENIAAGIVKYPLHKGLSGEQTSSWMNTDGLPWQQIHPGVYGQRPAEFNLHYSSTGSLEFLDWERAQEVGFIKLRPGGDDCLGLKNLRFTIGPWSQTRKGQSMVNYQQVGSDPGAMFDVPFNAFKNLISLDIDTMTGLRFSSDTGYNNSRAAHYPWLASRMGQNIKTNQELRNFQFMIPSVNLQGLEHLKSLKLAGCHIKHFLPNLTNTKAKNRVKDIPYFKLNGAIVSGHSRPDTNIGAEGGPVVSQSIWSKNHDYTFTSQLGGNPNEVNEAQDLPTSSLEYLNLEDNRIKFLNLGHQPNLKVAHLAQHHFNNANDFQWLWRSYGDDGTATFYPTTSYQKVDVTGCPNLLELDVSHGRYKNIDLTRNTKLELFKGQGGKAATTVDYAVQWRRGWSLGTATRGPGGYGVFGLNSGQTTGDIWMMTSTNYRQPYFHHYGYNNDDAPGAALLLLGNDSALTNGVRIYAHPVPITPNDGQAHVNNEVAIRGEIAWIKRYKDNDEYRNLFIAERATESIVDFTNNRNLREVIIPGIGNLKNRIAPLRQSYPIEDTTGIRGGTALSNSVEYTTDDPAGHDMSGLQFGYQTTDYGSGTGTHPSMSVLVAPYNNLESFTAQPFIGPSSGSYGSRGSLRVLNLDCNCLTSASVDISGSGGESLHSIWLRGNALSTLDLQRVGKYNGYGAIGGGTGSVFEIHLDENLLTDSSMFTASHIQDLKWLSINDNYFRHFPLCEENALDSQDIGFSGLSTTDKENLLPNKLEVLFAHNHATHPYLEGILGDGTHNLTEGGAHITYGHEPWAVQLPVPAQAYYPTGSGNGYSMQTGEILYDKQLYSPSCFKSLKLANVVAYPKTAGHALSMRGLSGSAYQNNFSQSFSLTAGWASNLKILTLDNTHISGIVTMNAGRKLQVLTMAACSMSKLSVEHCNHLRVLQAPYQGGGKMTNIGTIPSLAGYQNAYNNLNINTSTLTEVTMSSVSPQEAAWNNTGSSTDTGHPYLESINFERNMDLASIDLRGIDIMNWSGSVTSYEKEVTAGNWNQEQSRINQGKFNFYGTGKFLNPGYSNPNFQIIVKDNATQSYIESYRGTTHAYPFRMMTWATVSVI